MSLVMFEDYAFSPNATYIGTAGLGRGCLVGTRGVLLGLPERVFSGAGNTWVTTTYSIQEMAPGEAIRGIAELEIMTLDDFENSLRQLGKICEGSVLVELGQQKRLKLRAGLCTKGIYWSARASGPGWSGYGLGNRELTQQWIRFYEGHPISV
ncbi:MAG: hypothetical protein VX768_17080 [Planctomycetota bacterium]|nr:hypothetical protein [Planctomycetota bacterium]